MVIRQLGNSDLRITPVGIGAWAIGGGGWNGSMGPQQESDSIPAIHAALDHGLNWIDTAALYIGVSNFSVQQIRRALTIAPITSLQPPYSVVTREAEAEILPFASQHNIWCHCLFAHVGPGSSPEQ